MRGKKTTTPIHATSLKHPILDWEENFTSHSSKTSVNTGRAYLSYVRSFLDYWGAGMIDTVTETDLNTYFQAKQRKPAYRSAFQTAWNKFVDFLRTLHHLQVASFTTFHGGEALSSFPADAVLVLSQYVRFNLLAKAVWLDVRWQTDRSVVFQCLNYPAYEVPTAAAEAIFPALLQWGYGGNKNVYDSHFPMIPEAPHAAKPMAHTILHRVVAAYGRKIYAEMPMISRTPDMKLHAHFAFRAAGTEEQAAEFLAEYERLYSLRDELWTVGVRSNPLREKEARFVEISEGVAGADEVAAGGEVWRNPPPKELSEE